MEYTRTDVVEPPEAIQAAVDRILKAEGERRATERLGLSRSSVSKLAGGQPVRRGTCVIAALVLGFPEVAATLTGKGA